MVTNFAILEIQNIPEKCHVCQFINEISTGKDSLQSTRTIPLCYTSHVL